jgi:hypothetical protein
MKAKVALFISVALFAWACHKSDETGPELEVTQEMLDSATLINAPSDNGITGTPFGHRENDSTRFLIRDIFSNVSSGQSLGSGSVIAIRAYENIDGKRGKLKLIDLMVKKQSGYNTNGGDFEYMRIKYNVATDYSTHPNGLLPAVSEQELRGKDLIISPESCVSCHQKAGRNRFTFSRS